MHVLPSRDMQMLHVIFESAPFMISQHTNATPHTGLRLQWLMQRCLRWHWAWLPVKLLVLGLGFGALRFSSLRRFRPLLQTEQGLQLAGAPLDSTLNAIVFYRGTYEPVLTHLISQQVREGDLCVDAGANVGYFTLLLAQRVGASGHVVAIEPVPRNLLRLQRNLEANAWAERVSVLAAACGDEVGTTIFYVNTLNDMHCRMHLPQRHECDHWLMGGRRAWRSISVLVTPLSRALGDRASQVSFIKLDIEGNERLVVDDILTHFTHPSLQVALEAKAPHIQTTLQGFEAAGFHLYDLRNTYGWLLHTHTPSPRRMTYAQAYKRQHMVDVLVSRKTLESAS